MTRFYLFLNCFLLTAAGGMAQAKLVLNGGKINLTSNSQLVLANPAPDAVIRHSGHIISEGQSNQVKWLLGTNAGTYQVPFGFGSTGYLPLIFTKSAGTGNGFYNFSTYQTGWQNSASLPEGIHNLSGNGSDNSAFVLDRFWKIEPKDYTGKPALQNLQFTYLPEEMGAAGNYISEEMLGVQGWDETTGKWSGFQKGVVNTTAHTLSIGALPSDGTYNWWALVDKSSPLPLDFISFEAQRAGTGVKLSWETANEISCLNFEIQRSADGKSFATVGTEPAANKNKNAYAFLDKTPLPNLTYYRLKQNDADGKFKFTPIRKVMTEGLETTSFYPNPVTDRTLQIALGNAPAGKYTITLTDLKGSIIYTQEAEITQPQFQVKFPPAVNPGLYLVRLSGNVYAAQAKIVLK